MLRMREMGELESLNRNKEQILRMKKEKGGLTASTWFLKGKTSSVITCQATPGGVLARSVKNILNMDPSKPRILVTEDGGKPAISILRRSDLFKEPGCRFKDPTCIVERDRDCCKTGVIYEITCGTCSSEEDSSRISRDPGTRRTPNYVGMARTSVHWRMKSHLQGQRPKHQANPLYCHDCESHEGQPQSYIARIIKAEKDILPLAVLEALYIERQDPLLRMNERQEQGRGGLVRLIASRIT